VHLIGAWCLKGAPKGVIARGSPEEGHRELDRGRCTFMGARCLRGAPGGVIGGGGSPGGGHRERDSLGGHIARYGAPGGKCAGVLFRHVGPIKA
jgi:hypothetical protein